MNHQLSIANSGPRFQPSSIPDLLRISGPRPVSLGLGFPILKGDVATHSRTRSQMADGGERPQEPPPPAPPRAAVPARLVSRHTSPYNARPVTQERLKGGPARQGSPLHLPAPDNCTCPPCLGSHSGSSCPGLPGLGLGLLHTACEHFIVSGNLSGCFISETSHRRPSLQRETTQREKNDWWGRGDKKPQFTNRKPQGARGFRTCPAGVQERWGRRARFRARTCAVPSPSSRAVPPSWQRLPVHLKSRGA